MLAKPAPQGKVKKERLHREAEANKIEIHVGNAIRHWQPERWCATKMRIMGQVSEDIADPLIYVSHGGNKL
eukprot:1149889-Pelagomonas_calceolata.AAC.1